MLKKSVQDFFNQAKKKCDFFFASFSNTYVFEKWRHIHVPHRRLLKNRVFQQPASGGQITRA